MPIEVNEDAIKMTKNEVRYLIEKAGSWALRAHEAVPGIFAELSMFEDLF